MILRLHCIRSLIVAETHAMDKNSHEYQIKQKWVEQDISFIRLHFFGNINKLLRVLIINVQMPVIKVEKQFLSAF